MDKYEYKIRAEEIKELIAQGDYVQAAEIADTIDWRRVKSVMMLCTISDLYKINRRYEDARDLLLLAYERRPGGRTICYALCELSIKTEEYVQAVEYYKEFVQVAPKDPGRFILQYKLYEAQEVSLEERIEVLEELKRRDYREKWAYELAYLYHRVGLATRCVEECDELISMLGEGKYVIKAMELKMLHQPLSPAQQAKYDHRFDEPVQPPMPMNAESEPQFDGESGENAQYWGGDGAYYQEEVFIPEDSAEEGVPEQESSGYGADVYGMNAVTGDTLIYEPVRQTSFGGAPESEPEEAPAVFEDEMEPEPEEEQQEFLPESEPEPETPDELDIHVKTVDVGEYNTLNLQAELAQGLREVLGTEQPEHVIEDPITRSIVAPMMESDTESLDYPEIDEVSEDDLELEAEKMEGSEVFFGETGNIGTVSEELPEEPAEGFAAEAAERAMETPVEKAAERAMETPVEKAAERAMETPVEKAAERAVKTPVTETAERAVKMPVTEAAEQPVEPSAETGIDETAEIVMEQMRLESMGEELPPLLLTEPPREIAHVLAQESDGQISLVVPDSQNVEKQITGQMSIEDILAEWERMKQENVEKRKEEVRQHVLEQTGRMFTEFDAAVRDGLLEQLENSTEEETSEEGAEEFAVSEETEEIEELEEIEEGKAFEEAAESVEIEDAAEPDAEITGHEDAAEFEAAEEGIEFEDAAEFEAAEEGIEFEDAAEFETAEEATEHEDAAELEAAEEVTEHEDAAELETAEEVIELEAVAESETAKEAAESAAVEPAEAAAREKAPVRFMTKEERELYAPFIQSKTAREQIIRAIDGISLAAYTGNVIITGDEGMDTLSLAKNMVKEVQATDSNFSGKTAKITGQSLNKKDVADVIRQLQNGALIIQQACDMGREAVDHLYKTLQQESLGIVVLMEDDRKAMDRFLQNHGQLLDVFTARVDVEALSNDTLVAFGRQYAREMEYSIDELGVLALHTRIEERQTIDHAVTAPEVKTMVDNAIYHANKKTMKHFFDILLFKRYDEEDMIVLTEKDFA